ncbi:MAG: hypothetical protein IT489_10040 [Gammaproteobacteria bacterium]|nr:hypothetical protein [Gammaproteobacteria bacterium]
MNIPQRIRYLVSALICILNMVGMFLVVFSAAAGAHAAALLWPGIVLFVGGVLLLAIFSARRASQVGLSPWTTSIATILMCGLGPSVLILIIYLTVKDDKGQGPVSRPASPWFQWLALLTTPWAILLAIA